MSHKSSFSLSSINLVIDFFFRVDLPPYESKDVSKKKLKSPTKTISLSYKYLINLTFYQGYEELLVAPFRYYG